MPEKETKASKGTIVELLVSTGKKAKEEIKKEDTNKSNNNNNANNNNTNSNSTNTNKQNSSWSDWMETLPSGVTSSKYQIETKKQYSYRDKETTTSQESNLNGWTMYDQKATNNRIRKEKKNQSDSEIDKLLKSGNKELINKVYNSTAGTAHKCTNSNGQCVTISEDYKCPTGTSKTILPGLDLNGNKNATIGQLITIDGCTYRISNVWNKYDITYDEIQTTTTYYYYRYTDWSNYSDTSVTQNANREVRTRNLYRYKNK